LQGRFPIRVELENLTKEDFIKILTVPENALLKQHKMLLETEGIKVTFTEDSVEEIATLAHLMNEQSENIGARRLHTVMEKLVEDISYNLPDETKSEIVIDSEYVKEKFADKLQQDDIDRFIL
ncbi:MAG: HslU--HslV peptidase ATPase subunit, partial [Mobilitalea sp.]